MKSNTKQRTTRRHAKDSGENRRAPSLRHHKASGQGYVVLNGKAVYLGRYDTPEARQKYHQVISEWMAAGNQLPAEPNQITVKEVIACFWTHARQRRERFLLGVSCKSLSDRKLCGKKMRA